MNDGIRRRYQILLICALGIGVLIFMYYLRAVFNPFLLALALAYILNPIINWMVRKGAPRKSAIILTFLLLSTLFLAASIILIPIVSSEVSSWYIAIAGEPFEDLNNNKHFDAGIDIWKDLNRDGKYNQGYIEKLQNKLIASGENNEGVIAFIERFVPREHWKSTIHNAMAEVRDNIGSIARSMQKIFATAFNKGLAAAGWLWEIALLLLLTPIYMGFLLFSMNEGWQSFVTHIPARARGTFLDISRKIDIVIGAFFRGRLLVCAAIGLFTSIGFVLCGVKFGFILGILIGISSFIPFLNAIPFILALLVCWIDGMGAGGFVAVAAVYGLGQGIDPLLMTLVMGKELQLHPVTILLSMFACASLLGFFGMLLAVPIVAVAKILFVEFIIPHLRELAEEPT